MFGCYIGYVVLIYRLICMCYVIYVVDCIFYIFYLLYIGVLKCCVLLMMIKEKDIINDYIYCYFYYVYL